MAADRNAAPSTDGEGMPTERDWLEGNAAPRWECFSCQTMNTPEALDCANCGEAKPLEPTQNAAKDSNEGLVGTRASMAQGGTAKQVPHSSAAFRRRFRRLMYGHLLVAEIRRDCGSRSTDARLGVTGQQHAAISTEPFVCSSDDIDESADLADDSRPDEGEDPTTHKELGS